MRVYLPLFVNEVHAERVSREFHQAIHGNTKVTITFIFTGIEGQPIIHKATGIPAIHAYIQTEYIKMHKFLPICCKREIKIYIYISSWQILTTHTLAPQSSSAVWDV